VKIKVTILILLLLPLLSNAQVIIRNGQWPWFNQGGADPNLDPYENQLVLDLDGNLTNAAGNLVCRETGLVFTNKPTFATGATEHTIGTNVNGVVQKAWWYAGVDDYHVASTNVLHGGTDNCALSMWVWYEGLLNNELDYLFGKGGRSESAGVAGGCNYGLIYDGVPVGHLYSRSDPDTPGGNTAPVTNTMAEARWIHYAVIRDTSNSNWYWFVDGNLFSNRVLTAIGNSQSDRKLIVAAVDENPLGTVARFLKGYCDNIRRYQSATTPIPTNQVNFWYTKSHPTNDIITRTP